MTRVKYQILSHNRGFCSCCKCITLQINTFFVDLKWSINWSRCALPNIADATFDVGASNDDNIPSRLDSAWSGIIESYSAPSVGSDWFVSRNLPVSDERMTNSSLSEYIACVNSIQTEQQLMKEVISEPLDTDFHTSLSRGIRWSKKE